MDEQQRGFGSAYTRYCTWMPSEEMAMRGAPSGFALVVTRVGGRRRVRLLQAVTRTPANVPTRTAKSLRACARL